ncbi:MAG TPA: divalent metal cation transporter [Verrucomicrobiae bacterium]|nr:divalent metal cation transporter [Verrucomicrobiae bacterium]
MYSLRALSEDDPQLQLDDSEPSGIVARLRKLTPGIVAGAADLDPAAVLTATVAGASFGYSIGWVVLLAVPVLWAVFNVAARIGHHGGRGLVELIRRSYGRTAGWGMAVAMISVNMTMIIADLIAVSDAFSLILQQHRIFFLPIVAFAVWYLLVVGDYRKSSRALIGFALFQAAYLVAAVLAVKSWTGLLKGIFLPHFTLNSAYVIGIIAVFGSLLTPDVLVWQTSSRRDVKETGGGLHAGESKAGTLVAAIISLSVIIAASSLHVADPSHMSTLDAAQALGPLGALAPVIFSLGIIGSGLIALPILVASMCFSIAEAADWKAGLTIPAWEARRFYVLISASVLIATLIDFSNINTVTVLYWSQVFAGFLVVPVLIFIVLLGNNPRLTGRRNTTSENFWLGGAIAGMIVANLVFFWTQFVH